MKKEVTKQDNGEQMKVKIKKAGVYYTPKRWDEGIPVEYDVKIFLEDQDGELIGKDTYLSNAKLVKIGEETYKVRTSDITLLLSKIPKDESPKAHEEARLAEEAEDK